MKKYYLIFAVLAFSVCGLFYYGSVVLSQSERLRPNDTNDIHSPSVSPNLVISQFQAGGISNANDEFIEIFNRSSAAVDLNGYRVVYRSADGSNDVNFLAWTTTTILNPGQYYLIASNSYTGSVTPNATYFNSTCQCALGAAAGGLAIRQGALNTGAVIDAVGWGTGSSIFSEGTRTTAPGNSNSKARLQGGCQDTDNNANDFVTVSPSAPRNSSTSPATCTGGGTTLFAALNANPVTVSPSGTTLFTVTVAPATTPPSTGIGVEGNLSSIGGLASQIFYDNGTNGDVTPGDNVFSYLATIPAGTSGGQYVITSVAHDAQGRSVNLSVTITVNAPLPDEDPLILGNPSYATADIANENNYLMQKQQYSLSYSRSKATPNWTAWRLDSSWIGSAPRQDDFRPDETLPVGWYRVQDNDYSGSGFSRGHMTPSGDRTRSIFDNSATFLMTNMIPQLAANNEGPWNDLENYCRTLANQGNELYIISGPSGVHATTPTIAGGRITVPELTWKVVLVMPNGSDDLRRVNRSTRVFGIIVSNRSVTMGSAWRNYRVTVDRVEELTGYNFFSNVPAQIQEFIERRRDTL